MTRCIVFSIAACIAAVGTGLCSSPARAQEGLGEVPHAEPFGWANPLDGGAIETVVVAPRWTAIDFVRLAEQLEMDLTPVLLESRTQGGGEAWVEDLADAIDDKPDLIILANFDLGVLPPQASDAIAQAVVDGAGLVLAHDGQAYPAPILSIIDESTVPETVPDFEAGTGAEAIAEWSDYVLPADTWMAGEGRIVRLNYRGGFPETHALLPAFGGAGLLLDVYADAYLAYLVRAALWASDREMKAEVVGAEYLGPEFPDDSEIPPLPEKYIRFMREQSAHQPVRPYILRLAEPTDARFDVVTRVREFSDRPALIIQPPDLAPPFGKGLNALPFYMFDRSERALADAWILHRGQVAGSWTGPVDHDPRPHIDSIGFNRTAVRSFEIMEAAVRLTFPMHRPQAAAIFLHVTTPDGRVAGQGETLVPVDGDGTAYVSAHLGDLDVHRVTASIYVLEQESTEDIESAILFAYHRPYSFPVIHPKHDRRFGLYIDWDRPPELNTSNVFRAAQGMGVRGVFLSGTTGTAFLAGHAGLEPIQHTPESNSSAVSMRDIKDALQAAELRGVSRVALRPGQSLDVEVEDPVLNRVTAIHDGAFPADTPASVEFVKPLTFDGEVDVEAAARFGRWQVWRALIAGYDGVTHRHVYGSASDVHARGATLLTSVGAPSHVGDAVSTTMDFIGQGWDHVINRSAMPYSRVAILRADEDGSIGPWLEALWRRGVFPSVLRADDVERLTRLRYDALIIPRSAAENGDASRQIARFAAEGGKLFAESLPTFDFAPVLFGVSIADEAITATDAVPREVGESIFGYYNSAGAAPTFVLANEIVDDEAWGMIAELLFEWNVRRGPQLDVDEDEVTGLLVEAFAIGNGAVITALADHTLEDGPKLRFDRDDLDGELYSGDVANARTPGQRAVRLRPDPGQCALVVYLEGEVEALTMVAAENVIAGRPLHLAFRIESPEDAPTPGDGHVVSVTLSSLSALDATELHTVIPAVGGVAKGSIALPMNLAQGNYTVHARDILTGLETKQIIKVLPPARN